MKENTIRLDSIEEAIEAIRKGEIILVVDDEAAMRMVLEMQTLGLPMVLTLNMMDQARQRGITIDTAKLQADKLIRAAGAKGGGRPDMAEGRVQDLDAFLKTVAEKVEESL